MFTTSPRHTSSFRPSSSPVYAIGLLPATRAGGQGASRATATDTHLPHGPGLVRPASGTASFRVTTAL